MKGGRSAIPPFDTIRGADTVAVLFADDDLHSAFSRRAVPPAAAADAASEARDLRQALFNHDSETQLMLHSSSGPPLTLWISKSCSEPWLQETASRALRPFVPHRFLRLHLPGGLPRGTDCALHVFAELEDSLGPDRTSFLVDGRALAPSGPPFCTLDLPAHLTLGELFGFLRQAFPETAPAAFLRANGVLLTRLTLSRFLFPVIRALPRSPANEALPAWDDSLVPTADVLADFPGLSLSPLGAGLPYEATTTSTTTTAMWPAREGSSMRSRHLLFSPGFVHSSDPDEVVPWTLALPSAFPEQSTCEFVIHSFTRVPFRVIAPVPITAEQLQASVARALNQCEVTLCWPPFAPLLPGSPTHLAVWPDDLLPDEAVAVVDARRVGVVEDPPFWLCVLPPAGNYRSLVADALRGRQVCITPTGARLDGARIPDTQSFRPGVRLLTLLSGRSGEHQCAAVNGDPCSRLPSTAPFFLTPTCVRTSTTTTTRPDFAEEHRVTAALGLPPKAPLLVTFYASSGLCRPFALHAGRTIHCKDIVAALAFELHAKVAAPSMATWIASPRAFRINQNRFGVFLLTGYPDHEPRFAAVWVDLGALWAHPYPLHVASFSDWRQVRRRIYVNLPDAATVTVNGVIWPGDQRFFANGDVIQVRTKASELMSLPLHYLADRFPGIQLLGLGFWGPATHKWPRLDLRDQRVLFGLHFDDLFQDYGPVHDLYFPDHPGLGGHPHVPADGCSSNAGSGASLL